MGFINFYNRLENAQRFSDSTYALSNIPSQIMANMNGAVSGDVPVSTAHQSENDLMSKKNIAELMYDIAMAREEERLARKEREGKKEFLA